MYEMKTKIATTVALSLAAALTLGGCNPVVPVFVPASVAGGVPPRLSIEFLGLPLPSRVMLGWEALPFTTSAVEFKDTVADANWRVLTNYVNGPVSAPVRVYDAILDPDRMRLYRLQVNPSSAR